MTEKETVVQDSIKDKDPEDNSEIKALKEKLEECQKLKDEYLVGWQRSRADFLNYKREEMERIGELVNYANEALILKILPILDNFYLIEKKLPEDLKKNENIKGLLQIMVQFQDFLKNQGIEKIKAVGEIFDPNLHEVVESVEPSSAKATEDKEIKSGIIVEEIQKGYKINGRLLRPAKVKVIK